MNSEPEEIKVILFGEAATGKTSLINTSVGIPFKEEMISSSTNSFALKEFIVGEKKYFYFDGIIFKNRGRIIYNKNTISEETNPNFDHLD